MFGDSVGSSAVTLCIRLCFDVLVKGMVNCVCTIFLFTYFLFPDIGDRLYRREENKLNRESTASSKGPKLNGYF